MISFRNVTKTYFTNIDASRKNAMRRIISPFQPGRRPLRPTQKFSLEGLSFEVQRGETALILGPKGSGKETAARLICGLTSPSSGTVTVNGTTRLVKPQRLGATPVMRLREYARLVALLLGEDSRNVARTVETLLEGCHVSAWEDIYLHNVPDEAVKRLGFYASLMIDADVYVFDNVVGLRTADREFREQVDARIADIVASKTVVFLLSKTPRISADHSFIMHRGKFIYEGQPELTAAVYDGLSATFEEVGEAALSESLATTIAEVEETFDGSQGLAVSPDEVERVDHHLTVSLDAEKELEKIAGGGRPIIVGPYLGSIELELLFWIPWIRWLVRHFEIRPDRLVCVSRGGADDWYNELGARYVDALDLMSPSDLEDRHERRFRDGRHRQMTVELLDKVLFTRALAKAGISDREDADWLHPSTFFQLFMPTWRGTIAPSFMLERMSVEPVRGHRRGSAADGRPRVAVWFGATPYLRWNAAIEVVLRHTLTTIARDALVIDALTGQTADPPFDAILSAFGRSPELQGALTTRDSLQRATDTIANADVYVGAYGSFSYLAPLCGVPAVSLYTEPAKYRPSPHGILAVNLHVGRLLLEQLSGSLPLAFEASSVSAEELSSLIRGELAQRREMT